RHLQREIGEGSAGEGVGLVAERQHDLGHAVAGQPGQLVLEERPVDDGEQGLRGGPGQGPEPGALAAGQDDGLHGGRRYYPASPALGLARLLMLGGLPMALPGGTNATVMADRSMILTSLGFV